METRTTTILAVVRPPHKFAHEKHRPFGCPIYSDEALGTGDKLPSKAAEILQSENIELDEVVEAVQKIFVKIALPFSPHKATTIKQTEMDAILGRCTFRQRSDDVIYMPQRNKSTYTTATFAALLQKRVCSSGML